MNTGTTTLERHELPNGVRLLLIPVKGVESLATAVMVGVGSRYESSQINGVSHFLEHMVFKGTKTFPNTEELNVIERIGGLQNAYTDIDVTNYHNKVLSTDWRLALEINKELALRPKLEEKYIKKERSVILEEMKRYEDEPANKVGEVFHKMMYPNTRLGMRIIGEVQSLTDSNAKTLSDYHSRWYRPDNIVVIVSGGIGTSGPQIKKQVEEWFGLLKGAVDEQVERVTANQTKPNLEVVTKRDASQAHLTIGLHTFPRRSPDRYAWSVFNLIMGVGFTSRLFKEVREKRGLCYHIRSSSDTWADAGYWSIYAGVGTDKVEEATKAIMKELSKVLDKGVTSDDVAIAKKRLKTILAFKAEDPEFFVEYYGRQEVYKDPIIKLEDYIKSIDSITKEDISRLLKKYLQPESLNMALVWSKPREEKLLKYLRV